MTTITESFNQADSTTLGPNLTWTEVLNDLQTISNYCTNVTTTAVYNMARAESDLTGSNMYAQAAITQTDTTGNHYALVCVRYASATDTCYFARSLRAGTGSTVTVQMGKRVTGALTLLGTGTTPTYVAGAVLRIEVVGSTLTSFYNGTQQEQITNGDIGTGIRAGIGINSNTASRTQIDAFEAGDLGTSETEFVGMIPL